jgi:GNAT superfamily N-acetyltransferase
MWPFRHAGAPRYNRAFTKGAAIKPEQRIHWRPMQLQDLDAVVAIASDVHPLFPEERDVFANKLAVHPAGALLLEQAGHPVGYCFAHPWRGLQPPPLNTLLGAIPPAADTLYLHDLALLPAARGTGAGTAAIAILLAHAVALQLDRCCLVAVNGSIPYWSRLGFVVSDAPALRAKLASYGGDARLMVRTATSQPDIAPFRP